MILQVFPRGISDHNSITLSISMMQWGSKPFKWFDHWVENQELSKIIRVSCGELKGEGVMSALYKCKLISNVWAGDNRNQDPKSIQAIERTCNEIEAEIVKSADASEISVELRDLRAEL
ncbi:hypothetical protein V6N13_074450 [Hibiscus sabdariffa]